MKKKELRRITPREKNILKAIISQTGTAAVQAAVREITIALLSENEL